MSQAGASAIADVAHHEPADVDMDDGLVEDPLKHLISLVSEESRELVEAMFVRATTESKDKIGKRLPWKDMRYLRLLFDTWVTSYADEEKRFSTDPLSLGCLSAVKGLQDKWPANSQAHVKILASPGLTLSAMLIPKEVYRPPTHRQHDIVKDFARDFLGQGVHYLRSHILAVAQGFDYAKHYTPVIPIVQSSGSGKSKTAISLGELELGFFACVRLPLDQIVSEPKRDGLVAHWLCPLDGSDSATTSPIKKKDAGFAIRTNKRADRIAIWLRCFADQFKLRCLSTWRELYNEELVNGLDISDDDARTKWENFKRKMAADMFPSQYRREELITAIHERCEAALVDYETDLAEVEAAEVEAAQARKQGAPQTRGLELDEVRAKRERLRTKAIDSASQSWASLEAILPANSSAFIHLTIDECGTMGRHNLATLRRGLNTMKPKRSWILLLDTNTQISRLAGKQALTATARTVDGDFMPCRPFTELPIDLGMISRRAFYQRVCIGEEREQSHEGLRKIFRYMGRPLWGDDWLQAHQIECLRVAGIDLGVVINKLLGHEEFRGDPMPMAVLATQRFPLRMPGTHGYLSEKRFSEILVESHLRRLETIVPKVGTIITVNLSEPILSAAAAWHMRQDVITNLKEAIDGIHKYATQSHISIGREGEEFAILILAAAADGAATRWKKTFSKKEDVLKPISVVRWLRALVHPLNDRNLQPSNQDEDSQPSIQDEDMQPSLQMKASIRAMLECAGDYSLNFTHFVTMESQCTPTKPLFHATLVDLWLRNSAIIASPGQTGYDLVVPVYYQYKPECPFDARRVSFLPIQVKASASASRVDDWAADFAPSMDPFAGSMPMFHERIYLWLDLSAPKEGVDIRVDPIISDDARGPLRSTEAELRPRRFNLYIAGHSTDIYEPLHRLKKTTAPEKMASFIDPEYDYASALVDYEDLDQQLLARDKANHHGVFHQAAPIEAIVVESTSSEAGVTRSEPKVSPSRV